MLGAKQSATHVWNGQVVFFLEMNSLYTFRVFAILGSKVFITPITTGISAGGSGPESTARLPRPALLEYDWNAWLNFITAHVIQD